jgi:hypothetical protein
LASDRLREDPLINQLAEATRPPGGGSGGGGSDWGGSGGGGSDGGGSGGGGSGEGGSAGGGSLAGSGPETSNLTCSLFGLAGSLFQGSVGFNPFRDSHAISTLGKVTVDDLDRMEMSTYQEEGTNGRL